MCNSYSVTKAMLKQSKRAGLFRGLTEGEEVWKLIRPTMPGPVVSNVDGLAGEIMRWGFHRPFANAVNNTRSDKLDSPMWREAFAERRCVIPLSCWYEYSGPTGRKQAHEFTARDGGLLWAAGIWEENAVLGRCYSMIMTDSNGFVSAIHDRMPALLRDGETEIYLSGGPGGISPAAVELAVRVVASPLKRKPAEIQGDLFDG
jgi:putative SOS response-associated peptidase YedK